MEQDQQMVVMSQLIREQRAQIAYLEEEVRKLQQENWELFKYNSQLLNELIKSNPNYN